VQVILTSYDTLRVDSAALADLHPHAVIYDEAHKLKNSKSKQYEAALALPTKYRYGLSGTQHGLTGPPRPA
jgi:SNF2 family DNA or RNA helicase